LLSLVADSLVLLGQWYDDRSRWNHTKTIPIVMNGDCTRAMIVLQMFAKAGYLVNLYDSIEAQLEKAKAAIAAKLQVLAAYELVDAAAIPTIEGRVSYCTSLEQALAGVFYVQVRRETETHTCSQLSCTPKLRRDNDWFAWAICAQECVPEELELKKRVFATLDAAAAPETILASSSSNLCPSLFTESLTGRARCLVCHPVRSYS